MKLIGFRVEGTSIPASIISGVEVIGNCHDLWHLEQSFGMSKRDLRAWPIIHWPRDAIEAHLTELFTALALARFMHEATGAFSKRYHHDVASAPGVHRSFLGGQDIPFDPEVTGEAKEIVA